ncbi:hypothetical protein C8A05DRAFT_15661, partial [Staphylotrichum tortipilum]
MDVASASLFDTWANAASGTWTASSSGEWPDASDTDVEARDEFVQEYNRVARKPGQSPQQQRRNWFSRTFLRQASGAASSDASSTRSNKTVRRRRSVSDMALHLVNGTGGRRDNLKDEDLQSLVRLCGKSKLYLPPEYSPGSLILPTCFRATAQYLVQHGVFRIPGSVRTVNALYNHYCADGDVDDIASTICLPNLPSHIDAGAHDVASTFKRLLSGLPGGILGSVALFDAFVRIQDQLRNGDVGSGSAAMRQFKLRARLIALAVGTVPSQLRRDLICAVFGLLCLIGCAAEEVAREEADTGKPSAKSDLMGYSALGIVFGPLLVGDLLDSYVMPAAHSNASGSVVLAVTPANARREKRRGMRPLSSGLGGAKLSILSPPVEEPSPVGPEGPNGSNGARDSLDSWHPPAHQSAAGARGSYAAPRQWRLSSPVTPSWRSAGSNQRQNAERKPRVTSRGPNPFKRRSYKDSLDSDSISYARKQSAELPNTAATRAPQDVPKSATRGSIENHKPAEPEHRARRGERPMSDMLGLGRARLSAWRFGRKARGSTDTDSPAPRSRSPLRSESEVAPPAKMERLQLRGYKTGPGLPSIDTRQTYSSDGTGSLLEDWRSSMKARGETAPRLDIPSFGRGSPVFSDTSGKPSTSQETDTSLRISPLSPQPDPAQPTLGSVPRSTPVKSTGNAVRAMAAKFESVSKDPAFLPGPRASPAGNRSESKSGSVLSPYTINPSPARPPSRLPVPTDPIPNSRYMRLPTIPVRRSR